MVISHAGIILHIIIVLHQRCLNCSECFQRHALCFLYIQCNIRVTHDGAIKHIFYTNQQDPRRIISRLFFIHFVAPCALHLAVKILLQIFLYEDLSTLALTYICRLYFPPKYWQGPHFVTQPILLSENIPNI